MLIKPKDYKFGNCNFIDYLALPIKQVLYVCPDRYRGSPLTVMGQLKKKKTQTKKRKTKTKTSSGKKPKTGKKPSSG